MAYLVVIGLDNIDLKAADAAGVVVVAGLGANAVSVGELTLGLALAVLLIIASCKSWTHGRPVC